MPEERFYLFDERFAEALLHREHRVLGMRLLPFSYWHRLQLEWHNSKVLLGGAGVWDYWLAARICQSRWPHRAKLPLRRSRLWNLGWSLRHGQRDPEPVAVAFADYYRDFVSYPKFWGGGASGKKRLSEAYAALARLTESPAHQEAARNWAAAASTQESAGQFDESFEAVAACCHYTGASREEAWNMPVGELHWMIAAMQHFRGQNIQVWTPADDQRLERQKIRRNKEILRLSREYLEKSPAMPRDEALARATVDYWERVVSNVDALGK